MSLSSPRIVFSAPVCVLLLLYILIFQLMGYLSAEPLKQTHPTTSVFSSSRPSRSSFASALPSASFPLVHEALTSEVNHSLIQVLSPPHNKTITSSSSSSSNRQKGRSVFTVNVCEVCWCSKKRDSIDCRKANEITAIPVMKTKVERDVITEIIIQNQMSFETITRENLAFYPNLEKLTISNTGLKRFGSLDVFDSNKKLKEISLKNNQLEVIPWKLFDPLDELLDLLLDGNPLVCNCSSKWIQRQMSKENSILELKQKELIFCQDAVSRRKHLLANFSLDVGCDVPQVVVEPVQVTINESGSVNVSCTAIGNPPPKVSWMTSLSSNISTETLESVIITSSPTSSLMIPSSPSSSVESAFLAFSSGIRSNSLLLDPSAPPILASGQNFTKVSENLYIHSAHGSDNGYVTCVAENLVGKAMDAVLLEINGEQCSPPFCNLYVNSEN